MVKMSSSLIPRSQFAPVDRGAVHPFFYRQVRKLVRSAERIAVGVVFCAIALLCGVACRAHVPHKRPHVLPTAPNVPPPAANVRAGKALSALPLAFEPDGESFVTRGSAARARI